jgi:hypothetical protein
MIGDAREDIGEPSLRVDVVEPGGLDRRVDEGGTLPAVVGAAEQPCLAAKRNASKGDCQEFRVWAGIMGKKESHYVPTKRTCDPV